MKSLFVILSVVFGLSGTAQAEGKGKILFVVTNIDKLPDGSPSGIHFSELTQPYFAFLDSGFQVDFASIKGGNGPVDPATLELQDPFNKRFWNDPALRAKLSHTVPIERVSVQSYESIFLVGGITAMWDFPFSQELAKLIAQFYDRGRVVGAVCHGPAALVNVTLADGSFLVNGKDVSAFTNEEETGRLRQSVVPFLLESRLVELGANFTRVPAFKYHVVSDGRLVSGQNPASAFGVAHEMIRILRSQ